MPSDSHITGANLSNSSEQLPQMARGRSHGPIRFVRRPSKFIRRGMDRIRRSFRDSFRRRSSKDRELNVGGGGGGSNSSSKPQQWQQDEASVRAGTCSFHVKYLGCVEVFESRGMQVCEEALKVLRAQRRRTVRGVLYVSGDGLRVVDGENNRGLIVDQTIEKVSFCAPDRNHEKGFAYICRDGTTRRWMCHGFHASKETGERLSHAVGCAFAVCLEKKQKRDRDGQVESITHSAISNQQMTTQSDPSSPAHTNAGQTFQRQGSFRQASLTERLQDPQNVIIAEPPPPSVPIAPAENPYAVARPAPNPQLFTRQGSLRMPEESQPNFRRQYSLRIGDLPSTLQRQQEIGMPGARVSAIPEEEDHPSPPQPQHYSVDQLANSVQAMRAPITRADTWASPQVNTWDQSFQEEKETQYTPRSKAQEWLENVLQTTAQQPVLNGNSDPTPPPAPVQDVFGLPQFNPTPSRLSSSSGGPSPTWNAAPVDPFEAKWKSLEKPVNTNPFINESATVDI